MRNEVARKCGGFSLVELVVTMAVAAILLAIATPSLAQFFRTNRVASATNELVLSLQLARAEAARRGRDVSLCRSTDGSTCASGTGWSAGWIVFQDANTTGAGAPTGTGSELIRVFDALDASISLTGPTAVVRFRPDGTVQQVAPDEVAFGLTVQNCSGKQQRAINVSRLGRVRTSSEECDA
jgi:type IV fimbrial biogenesis protein FimT